MTKKLINIGLCVTLAFIYVGCGTTTLQTKAKLTRTIVLDHQNKENKLIYLQVSNTTGSGGENMTLYSDLKENLESKGYTVITTSKGASYELLVNVLFANSLKEANAIKAGSFGLRMGRRIGLATGSDNRDALVLGAIMALGAATIGKTLEDDVFRAVVDISIRDYRDTIVKTIKSETRGSVNFGKIRQERNLNQFTSSLKDKNSTNNIVRNKNIQTEKNYEEFKTRAFVEAIRMDLEMKDALPILQAQISRKITNLF